MNEVRMVSGNPQPGKCSGKVGGMDVPRKVRDKSFRVPPWRVWGPGERWSVDHTLGTQQAIKKKKSFSLAHTL